MSESRVGEKIVRLWPWLAAALSGALAAACFPPFNQTWACWIALTPLLAAIWFSGANKRRGVRDLLLGYVAGVVFFWSGFSWLRTVTIPGLILVGLYLGVYFALWGWLAGLARPRERSVGGAEAPRSESRLRARALNRPNESAQPRSPWLSSLRNLGLAFILACAWTALEWVRGWLFSGWGWNGLGVALHKVLPIIQIAEFTGVAGLSFVVVFANVIAVATVRRFMLEMGLGSADATRPAGRMRPHYDFTLTMAAIVGLCAFGLRELQSGGETLPLRVAAVQANVPREEKFTRQFQQKTFDQFARLTHLALAAQPPPQLILWPESAMPGPVLVDQENHRFVMELAAAIKTDLLLGSIDEDEKGAYNAAMLVSEGGARVQLYRKLHLVPFGEYVPGRHTVPFIAQIVGDQVPDDFAVGRETTIFRLANNEVRVAPLICFEDTLGDLVRQFVLRGANLLANVTNDGWFLHSAGSQQHLANAIFRCVETRRPLVRAANTGVTCLVDQFGRVTQVLTDAKGSTFTEGVLSGTVAVPTGGVLTFYVRHGDLFAELCGCVTLLFVVVMLPQLVRRPRPGRAEHNGQQ